MYERFSDRARKIMQIANDEALHLNHEYIGTEHILLAIVKEGSGVAASVLKSLDIDLPRIRIEFFDVEKIVQPAIDMAATSKRSQSPCGKSVVKWAIEESRNFKHDHVDTEHLLLGLLREREGAAAVVLEKLGVEVEDVREKVLLLLGPATSPPSSNERNILEEVDDHLPADVRQAAMELSAQIDRINREQEEAVAEQDFAKAAHLRDQADKLKKRKKAVLDYWVATHPIDPSWLSKNNGLVDWLARAIDRARCWDALPILADALAEAGCGDLAILAHCRHAGKHPNRCWVVDLILGKV